MLARTSAWADYAKAVCDAAQAVDPEMIVVCQDGELSEEAKRRGLPVAIVGIVDRAYRPDGTLVPRSEPGAVIHDLDTLVARAIRIATESTLEAVDGTVLDVRADSLLLHGDNAGAVTTARAIRDGLTAAGVDVRLTGPMPTPGVAYLTRALRLRSWAMRRSRAASLWPGACWWHPSKSATGFRRWN